jgi:hypothetical protein
MRKAALNPLGIAAAPRAKKPSFIRFYEAILGIRKLLFLEIYLSQTSGNGLPLPGLQSARILRKSVKSFSARGGS